MQLSTEERDLAEKIIDTADKFNRLMLAADRKGLTVNVTPTKITKGLRQDVRQIMVKVVVEVNVTEARAEADGNRRNG